jgi:hypothetical protein
MEKLFNSVLKYAQKRDKLINYVIDLTKLVYPKDKDMITDVVNLTSSLLMSDPDDEFLNGMIGFINYADKAEDKNRFNNSEILTTLIHDLGEFSRNRHEPWFLPRTHGYIKYA